MGTLEKALSSMGAVPECACGVAMKHVEGVGKTGRPYSGFVCANKVKEHALWDK